MADENKPVLGFETLEERRAPRLGAAASALMGGADMGGADMGDGPPPDGGGGSEFESRLVNQIADAPTGAAPLPPGAPGDTDVAAHLVMEGPGGETLDSGRFDAPAWNSPERVDYPGAPPPEGFQSPPPAGMPPPMPEGQYQMPKEVVPEFKLPEGSEIEKPLISAIDVASGDFQGGSGGGPSPISAPPIHAMHTNHATILGGIPGGDPGILETDAASDASAPGVGVGADIRLWDSVPTVDITDNAGSIIDSVYQPVGGHDAIIDPLFQPAMPGSPLAGGHHAIIDPGDHLGVSSASTTDTH